MLRSFASAAADQAGPSQQAPPGPVAGCTVFLRKKTGRSYLQTTDSTDKTVCIHAFLSYVRAASFTLDIAFFSCLHNRIVVTIMQAFVEGVRVRIVLDIFLLSGKKRKKYKKNVYRMKKLGIQFRWLTPEKMPLPKYRIVLIDASDPERRPQKRHQEVGAVSGTHVCLRDGIVYEMQRLTVVKEPCVVNIWTRRFEDLWDSLDSDSD